MPKAFCTIHEFLNESQDESCLKLLGMRHLSEAGVTVAPLKYR